MSTEVISVRAKNDNLLKKVLGASLFIAAGVLLARIELLSSLCPFGPALISACFLTRREMALFAAAGVVLGSVFIPEAVYVVTVSMIICISMLFLKKPVRWMAVASCAAAYLIGAVIFKTSSIGSYMSAVLECIVSLIMSYVFAALIQIFGGKKRSVFSAEETVCLTLGAMTVICMFGPVNFLGVYIGDIIAMVLVLCSAYTGGAALGAGVGLALGMALCLGVSAEPGTIGMMGLSGMAAGTIKRLKKPGTAIGYFMVCMLFIISFYKVTGWYTKIIAPMVASLVFISIPERFYAFAGKFIDMRTKREYEYKLHSRRFKDLTVGRLKEVSEVFLQTGEMFSREARDKIKNEFSISGLLSIVAESACRNCVFRKSCWDKDFINTYNVFSRLFIAYEKNGELDRESVDPAFLKKCYNVDGILSAADSIFSAYLLNVKRNKKIEESRIITGKQLKGVAKVVSDISKEMDTGFNFLESVEQGITIALDTIGLHAKEVCAENSSGGGMAVAVRLKKCGGTTSDCRSGVEKAVSEACGVSMKRLSAYGCKGNNKFCTLRFEQAKKYKIITAAAHVAKGKVSGDSYSFESIKDGRFMMTLCDGMGSGEKAKNESSEAISLIENFYQAGFDESIIYETINRLLVLKDSEDIFSTVDMCMIDLKTGKANFVKVGAESSYILSGGKVTELKPGSLPLGILDEVEPARNRKELCSGDIIVMVSDGIEDKIQPSAEEWFSDIDKSDIKAMAEAILKKARGEEPPPDDMTVIAGILIDNV